MARVEAPSTLRESDLEPGETIRAGRTFTVRRARLRDGALNVICKSPTRADPDALARLENEFQITRGLDHPGHAVAFARVEGGESPTLLFNDEGLESLDRCLDGPVEPSQVRAMALTLAETLGDLHEHGIVHRDVKPSNIIVSSDLKTARLIDYCMAIRSEDLAAEEPGDFLAQGTAAYMAPEQGGRSNLRVDHRADLYALGVVLYELLTGERPFGGDDAAEVLHAHMTLVPPPPSAVRSDVPEDLSNAVMTLLAKTPGDRFASAAGLIAALTGRAATQRFTMPDRLFGRDQVIEELAAQIKHGAVGPNRLYRIAGPSGVGKSVLIDAIAAPAIENGACFIHGKFDQLDRARPYGPFVEAANLLLRRILSSPDAEVDDWRARLLDAISPNGQVLLDLLPEYQALIGSQPAIAKLGLNEARIRVSLVFRRFFRAIARNDVPLIVFIDDLQWSDAASRDLIRLLLGDEDIRNLTLITAYRDNEVGPAHPVTELFEDLAQSGLGGEPVTIGPLQRGDIADLAAAALDRPRDQVTDLADLVWSKTGGNPFFVRQFLFALYRKGLLQSGLDGWTWETDRIRAEEITDNVADLVIDRIRELPDATQTAVCVAACIGASFDLATLALVTESPAGQTRTTLDPALAAEILLTAESVDGTGPSFRFQHDRVQEAAVTMIEGTRRAQIHARIGQLMLASTKSTTTDRQMVTIVDHLIAGREHITPAEAARLQDLVLMAARRTKQANAWDAALAYLDVATELQGPNAWQTQPDRAFGVALERAEAAYLRGTSDRAEDIARELLARDLDRLDRVKVLELVILIHTGRLEYHRALQVGQEALALLGERLPISPGAPRLLGELAHLKLVLRGRSDESLLTLPRMTDPEKLAIVRVLGLLAPPAYFTELYLLPLIGLRIVKLSVRHGNAPHSAYGYVIYGMLHCAVLGAPDKGRAFGELARALVARHGAHDIEGRVLMVYAGFIQHWTARMADTLPVFLDGAERAIAVGDLEYHGYTRYGHGSYALMAGQPLGRVADYLTDHLTAVRTNTHEKTQRIMQMAAGSIARMRALPEPETFADQENFDLWTAQSDATSLAYFHKYRLLEGLMAGNYAQVLEQAGAMEKNLNGILSMGYQPFYQFYEALALLELARSRSWPARTRMIWRARRLTRRLAGWARSSPETLDHRVALLRAEADALSGNVKRAIAGFASAIAKARTARALHDVGLFNERVARFYLNAGAEQPASTYLAEARNAYRIWGGIGWVNGIERRHKDLLRPEEDAPVPFDESTTSSGRIIDSATLISVASALTSKTSLTEVIEEVMQAMALNAGADRGVLLLMTDGALKVVATSEAEAEITLDDGTLLQEHPDLPAGLIQYVARSARRVVLDEARLDPEFGDDPRFRNGTARAVLCVPLMAKGEVTGIVYLENTRMAGAFTRERCETIAVLGAQAAVSVENARLVDELRGALERQVDLTSAHARFVPHSFLEMMNRPSITDVKLGDHVEAEASILFSDIRGFTRLVESMEPAEAIDFINAYLSRMEPAVQAGGGFVDSYIGDAVMAVFDRGPEAAILAGIEMIRALRTWARTREGADGAPIRIGVGIATGQMMFGTIGAANRLKCGVIGDPVNLASRIEGLTKTYNLGLLITQGTYRALPDPDRFQIREVDLVTVVGRTAPVRLMEVFDADASNLRAQKAATADDVARALRLYRSGSVAQAGDILHQCRAFAPDDPLIPMLLQRCQQASALAADAGWDGIQHHSNKN